MFSLKNITSFSEFKKMYEAAGETGTEYSNNTGFSQSLVGRATIGLCASFRLRWQRLAALRVGLPRASPVPVQSQ